MATEQRVISYLRDTVSADAAILVGSRAHGSARPESDWDCYALLDDGLGSRGPTLAPARVDGAQLDVGIVHLPIASVDVLRIFGPNLQSARVLFDTTQRAAAAVLVEAAAIYAKGRHIGEAERAVRAHQMSRNIATMVGRRDESGPFFEALSFVFY